MSTPEKEIKTLAESVEEERLRLWREKRAKVAEASRQERLRAADLERQARLKAFEEDKAKRVREAAERRAQEAAQERAERMARARARIASRADIEAARKRLHRHRVRAAKWTAARLAAFILLPLALYGYYLSAIATPFYSASAQFALTETNAGAGGDGGARGILGLSGLTRETHLVRQMLHAPQTQDALNGRAAHAAHFAAADLDALTQLRLSGIFGAALAVEQHVDVAVNGPDGLVEITARALDPQSAVSFAEALILHSQEWITETRRIQGRSEAQIPPLIILSAPKVATLPGPPEQARQLILALAVLSALYALGGIFLRTLMRHARH